MEKWKLLLSGTHTDQHKRLDRSVLEICLDVAIQNPEHLPEDPSSSKGWSNRKGFGGAARQPPGSVNISIYPVLPRYIHGGKLP
jgi:hypothetical protein